MFKLLGFVLFGVLTVYFNLYKINIFERILETNESYTIFPWMKEGQVSSSNALWLLVHVHVAFIHIALTSMWILNFLKSKLHVISHWMFSATIIVNLHHFGEAPFLQAIIANGLPLLIMNIVYEYYPRQKMIYFLALVSPVLLEVLLYVKEEVS